MWSIPGKLTLSTNTMKKLCFLLSLAAIVGLGSCSRDFSETDPTPSAQGTHSLKASIVQGEPSTRTGLGDKDEENGTTPLLWVAGDQIAVIDDADPSTVISTSSTPLPPDRPTVRSPSAKAMASRGPHPSRPTIPTRSIRLLKGCPCPPPNSTRRVGRWKPTCSPCTPILPERK